ncbi:MAG: hypothetical protein IKN25_02805, partial [Spirochaetales bacterium]|nr:hypothetical protein [Spirochaetales bacterium]
MATSIIFFLLAITINIAVILVFKKLDDEKNSFSKVTKYCKKFMEDLNKDFAEKKIQMKDFDDCLETKLQRGSIILDKLDDSVSSFDGSGKVSVSPELIKRLNALESKLADMEDKSYSPSAARMTGSGSVSRELYNQL